MPEKDISILYVDDEPGNLTAFKANFRRLYNVFTAESGPEGRLILDENPIQIIITDQRMPGMTGVEFLESIIPHYPDAIRILLTGYSDISAVIDSINKGQVYKYITKPWNEDELKITIENAFEVYALRKQNKELLVELEKVNRQLEFLLRQHLLS